MDSDLQTLRTARAQIEAEERDAEAQRFTQQLPQPPRGLASSAASWVAGAAVGAAKLTKLFVAGSPRLTAWNAVQVLVDKKAQECDTLLVLNHVLLEQKRGNPFREAVTTLVKERDQLLRGRGKAEAAELLTRGGIKAVEKTWHALRQGTLGVDRLAKECQAAWERHADILRFAREASISSRAEAAANLPEIAELWQTEPATHFLDDEHVNMLFADSSRPGVVKGELLGIAIEDTRVRELLPGRLVLRSAIQNKSYDVGRVGSRLHDVWSRGVSWWRPVETSRGGAMWTSILFECWLSARGGLPQHCLGGQSPRERVGVLLHSVGGLVLSSRTWE